MTSERDKQFNRLRSRANIDKEREKESSYREIILSLLKQHKDILKKTSGGDDDSSEQSKQYYKSETKILKKLMDVERDAIFGAVTVGIVAFASMRYLPRLGIRLMGGKEKVNALQQAEKEAKSNPTMGTHFKSAGAFIFEGTLAFWAANRGYHMAISMSMKPSDNVYEDVVKLPMCDGRSAVSDSMCEEWSSIVRYKIPTDFWRNLDNQGEDKSTHRLKDEDFWRAVLKFEDSCSKRMAFEKIIRQHDGLKDDDAVVVPEPGVPTDVFELSDDEIEMMLSARDEE